MVNRMTILGFSGSLRKNSYNKGLLHAARELVPKNVELLIFDLEGIPIFNQDFVDDPPEIVEQFKNSIKSADAILMATPEYNYSVPGVLKNAIDWASRPFDDNAFKGKPVAIMGASTGRLGTARAQYHLRQCFVYLEMIPLNKPEVFVTFATEKFDEKGNLKDQETKEYVRRLLDGLVAWTEKLKGVEAKT